MNNKNEKTCEPYYYIQQDSFYVIHILKLNYHILGATVENS